MIFTDTLAKVFDKISMDIVGPLLIVDHARNNYILIAQDLLNKYSIVIPFQ